MSDHERDALHRAYLETDYKVMLPQGEHIVMRIGETNAALAKLLQNHGVLTAAFISPENPKSKQLDDLENYERCKQFEAELCASDSAYLRGSGESWNQEWPGENSFLILGVDEQTARRLAFDYEQNAFVFVGADGVPLLVWVK